MRRFGLNPDGSIVPGSDADLVILDPRRPVTIENAMLESSSDFDVYAGLSARGWPVAAISRGEVIWHDGTITATPSRGRLIRRDLIDYHGLALGRW